MSTAAIRVGMYIPDEFFESARGDSKAESSTEKLARAYIVNLLKIDDKELPRGNPIKHEPDFVYGNEGFEVTIGMKNDFICQLKSEKPLCVDDAEVNQRLADGIRVNIKKKVDKQEKAYYCVPTSLVVICALPCISWEFENLLKPKTIVCDNIVNTINVDVDSIFQFSCDNLFNELGKRYINSKLFKNINLILPSLTYRDSMIVYDIQKYLDGDRYRKGLRTINPSAIVHCKEVNTSFLQRRSALLPHSKIDYYRTNIYHTRKQ